MEAIYLHITLTTSSGKIVYEVNQRVTNQQKLSDLLQELKNNVKVRVAIKEQPTLDL